MERMDTLDQQIVARYAGQPARLPAALRREIESAWQGPVLLYAFADLSPSLQLAESWVALGASEIAVARRAGPAAPWEIDRFLRRRIRAVREAPGLSATTLTLSAEPDDPPLAVVRFTHRQRRAFENLRFVLEEELAGKTVQTPEGYWQTPGNRPPLTYDVFITTAMSINTLNFYTSAAQKADTEKRIALSLLILQKTTFRHLAEERPSAAAR